MDGEFAETQGLQEASSPTLRLQRVSSKTRHINTHTYTRLTRVHFRRIGKSILATCASRFTVTGHGTVVSNASSKELFMGDVNFCFSSFVCTFCCFFRFFSTNRSRTVACDGPMRNNNGRRTPHTRAPPPRTINLASACH